MHSKTPFADPLWLTRGLSPYYSDSHRRLQEEVRKYVDEHITPFCEEWESEGVVPQEVSFNKRLALFFRQPRSQT